MSQSFAINYYTSQRGLHRQADVCFAIGECNGCKGNDRYMGNP